MSFYLPEKVPPSIEVNAHISLCVEPLRNVVSECPRVSDSPKMVDHGMGVQEGI